MLQKQGYTCMAVQSPLTSLADDLQIVQTALDHLNSPTLLVGHSWGGAVISQAGNHPQVKGLVYIAAGAPDNGQSFNDWWASYPPSPVGQEIKPYGKTLTLLSRAGVNNDVAQDLTPTEQAVFWSVQRPLGMHAFNDKITTAAWHSKPTWYVIADNDRTVPTQAQVDAAERMSAKTIHLQSSHVPMLSQPEAIGDFITRAAKSL